ncbi:OmpA family protein [Brumimicrobium mesophilum]|uniref:OmpA family protein n=1 Tax=Brumimicrobium mesophilum TaxID=392717 RepID=UPI000D14231A|nr:OmpA family protein [Brumimicrobium mesophilum]
MRCLLIILIALNISEIVGQTENGNYKTFSNTLFESGDIIITPEIIFGMSGHLQSYPKFKDSTQIIRDFLIKHPDIKIEIGVHTDQRGSEEGNLELSEKRANAIKLELIKLYDISPHKLKSKGYGEFKPLIKANLIEAAETQSESEKLHRANRRTELTILDQLHH